MQDLTVKDLLDLAATEGAEAEKRIEKIFDWYHIRALELTRAILALAASLLVAVLIGFMKKDFEHAPLYQPLSALSVGLGLIGYGVYRLVRLREITGRYIVALRLTKKGRILARVLAGQTVSLG